MLSKRGIKHEVLNAKNHEREAAIVAQAGRTGAVTIATNMAGRGTDILLGGNPEAMAQAMLLERFGEDEEPTPAQVKQAEAEAEAITNRESKEVLAAGGLCVIGTERHESRRIDNQLRGRAGRQGDPGCNAVLPFSRRRPYAFVWWLAHGFYWSHDGKNRHARRYAY